MMTTTSTTLNMKGTAMNNLFEFVAHVSDDDPITRYRLRQYGGFVVTNYQTQRKEVYVLLANRSEEQISDSKSKILTIKTIIK